MSEGRRSSVVIVGAGIGGIAAAIELRKHGFEDIVILERAPALGGTWFYNSCPGAACDVPSHLYSFSFAQRRDWSRLCSPQAEILEYLGAVAREHGVEGLVSTDTDVSSCSWEDHERRWTVCSSDGRSWSADAVVIATGQLHQPAIPRIEGADEFTGRSFHSSNWDHDYDFTGGRVAVIGTGASAVQFVPELAKSAARLTVFQRTGNRFLPRRNRPFTRLVKGIIEHVPGIGPAQGLAGLCVRLQAGAVQLAYLPTLERPNVELVTDAITRMTPTGIVTADGTEREFDCVIWGTGFHTDHFMFPIEVTGAGRVSLREAWADGAHAHLGILVPGFPSMFMIYGPNTNTSGGSIIVYEETQAAYIRQALELAGERGVATIDVAPDVEARSDRALQARFAGTAWTRCDSWYRDDSGRIIANWPGYMREYEARLAQLDPSEYSFLALPDRSPVSA